ncbi:MAG: alcohol dehydrogenase catalytic domain-containing protein [Deltaproteobacteria bacterium]|nr:alcohol dehydrogenase catalytic domain-containing protein [Deltaproteobacteria bacterium]
MTERARLTKIGWEEDLAIETSDAPFVTDWSIGDRVASTHRDYCGQCEPCKRESGSLCQGAAGVLGLMIDGGYASHLLAPERCFYAMADDIPAAEAAVLHCTFGTAYGSAGFGHRSQWRRRQCGRPSRIAARCYGHSSDTR